MSLSDNLRRLARERIPTGPHFKNHREWLENCGADLDRKLQNAMKSSERCLFLPIPFVEVLEGLLARRQRKD